MASNASSLVLSSIPVLLKLLPLPISPSKTIHCSRRSIALQLSSQGFRFGVVWGRRMNHCAVQRQSAFSFCDEVWSSSSSSSSMERREAVVCPKPRRLGAAHDPPPGRSLRWHVMHQAEPCDSRSEREVLDALLTKGSLGNEPPFFSGSPPSRVANPLIHDARFGNEKPFSVPPLPSTPPSARKGGCVRGSFGNAPAVRVEGFDCLDRDGRNCRIPALA